MDVANRSEFAAFLRQLIRNPRQTSALAPSSRTLGRAMTAHLGAETGKVCEFGPGTGRLTEAILNRNIPERDLTLFELSSGFARDLRLRFPAATVHERGAQEAATLCAPDFGAVVSGLPLLSMPVALRRAIVGAAFAILRPGGVMTQFTYGPRAPLSDDVLADMGLRADPGPRVWQNLPPARVYLLRRKGE